jgi:hypothetical protein
VSRRRIDRTACAGAIVDVQGFFLSQLAKRAEARLRNNLENFARLLGYFRIPIVVTLERPVERKGALPSGLKRSLIGPVETFHKSYFDLTRDRKIADHLARLKKTQILVAGCETDVCVLQSCLGLVDLGYDVFAVEELLFSSAKNVDAALARLRGAGVIFVSYKTLFFELLEAVEGEARNDKSLAALGPIPDDLPEKAI